MKYLLINQQTGEETICDKVTVDGFDYYVTNIKPIMASKYFDDTNVIRKVTITDTTYWSTRQNYKSITACTNPNIDIPQVVDEDKVIKLAFKHIACTKDSQFDRGVIHGFVAGYHKSQETHPFSEEDADAYADAVMGGCLLRAKEWKSQQPKKVYYKKTTDK